MAQENPPREPTVCARSPAEAPSVSTPLAPSIDLSIVFRIANLDQVDALYEGRQDGFFYARDGHPNAVQLAAKIAELEGAEAAMIGASGMAAIAATFLSMLGQGDHAVIAEGLYGKTTTLVAKEFTRFGVEHASFDATRPETLPAQLTPRTRLIFAETLSNPLLRVAELEVISQIARDARIPLVVDHTFAPLLCRPLALGASIVIHSVTKLIGGHSDLTLGAAAGSKLLIDRIRALASTFGQTGNPFESWLALRGLATLSLRAERTSATAFALAQRLESHAKVRRVFYPGLSSHPDFALARRLFPHGHGAMVTFDLGGRDQADSLIRQLRHIPFAPSLGDVQTTLSHPCTTSHRAQPPEVLERLGITPGLIRLSLGLEHPDDLWDDLRQALEFC